ncbi:MAG: cyclic 2,3-diphosphoglycerate synthase [Candidatus Hodarchaeales archaeon]|jgi:predicted GTPase
MKKNKIIIMGAAGMDFHVFNTYFRDNEEYEVVGFTAAQIPNIEGRNYPMELAGSLYPEGIPIFAESSLPHLISEHSVDQVVLAYSDLPHLEVMHKASIVIASGADFRLMGANHVMVKPNVPVVAVCAVRTGAGKSQTTRRVAKILRSAGKRVVVIRHPMPYGDLRKQICQRFESREDMDKHDCTIEEREEYEPHIDNGIVVYAGVDYQEILNAAQKEADVIVWDGGNNDLPFYQPNVHFVVADPHRPGHELAYHPGEANLRRADVVIINKIQTAAPQDIEVVEQNIRFANPKAQIIKAASPITVEDPDAVKGKRILAVEDGPTLTHGEMQYGAAWLASKDLASEIIDPRPAAVGSIKEVYAKFTHLGKILPAMGYGSEQIKELEQTINGSDCDIVVIGTPIDLGRLLTIEKPSVRVNRSATGFSELV